MLVEYIPSLIAVGLILVPVILWSDILTAWFRNWFNGKRENQLLYLLAVTVGGAVILWILSYLTKDRATGGVGGFFTSILTLISLAAVFFVASTWANVIRNAIAGAISPSNNARLWYVVAATVVPLIILWIMGSLGLLPQIDSKKNTASLPGVTVTA